MKIKAILLAIALSGVSAFAQGLVTFQNSSLATPIKVPGPNGEAPANIDNAGAYSFYFIYGLSSDNLNNTSATYLNGSPGRIAGAADIALSVAGGQPVFFQMFGYSTSAGSFANATTAQGAAWYQSSVITQTPSVSPTPGTPLFGPGVGTQFQGFTMNLNPVPEPTTIALGILGAGSLLFLRRKK